MVDKVLIWSSNYVHIMKPPYSSGLMQMMTTVLCCNPSLDKRTVRVTISMPNVISGPGKNRL